MWIQHNSVTESTGTLINDTFKSLSEDAAEMSFSDYDTSSRSSCPAHAEPFSTPYLTPPALLPAWCHCKLDHWNNPDKSNLLDRFGCWRKCLPMQQLFTISWPFRQQWMSWIVFPDALFWDYSSAKAKSLWTCQVRQTLEQVQSCWNPRLREGLINFKIKGILEKGEGIVMSLFIAKPADIPRWWLWEHYPVLLESRPR